MGERLVSCDASFTTSDFATNLLSVRSCNALYSDLTMAAQFAPPSSAAPLSLIIPRIALVSLVVAVAFMLCS